mmetsp:Transcript_18706/g.51200  ORF Transcript_18706/g.51200 Transcript_18706/m.51200 type:complete len:476 (-) Transcript_18706:7-1434(-)
MERVRLTAAAAVRRGSPNRRHVTEWSCLFGTEIQDEIFSNFNDLTCKIHRPSWLKTFDIWSPADATTASFSNLQLQVSTVIDSGFDIRSNYGQSGDESSRETIIERQQRDLEPSFSTPQTVRYMNLGPSTSSTMNHLALLDSNERQSSLLLRSLSSLVDDENSGALQCRICFQYPFPAHDVVEDGGSGFVIASSRKGLWHTALGANPRNSPLTIQNLSKSEILCLDRLGTRGQHICLGHRSGMVSLFDQRNPQVASALDENSSNKDGDDVAFSIASIKGFDGELNESGDMREHMILVRKKSLQSTSLCTVWDVRNNEKPLFRLALPASTKAHSRFTQKCSGMALDPYGSTLFSPFVHDHVEGERPCLGVWSLLTGEWVGSKSLANVTDDIPVSSSSTVSWVELSCRRSSGWERTYRQHDDTHHQTTRRKDSERDFVQRVEGSYGFWYKCGYSPNATEHRGEMPPNTAGNIHHIVI